MENNGHCFYKHTGIFLIRAPAFPIKNFYDFDLYSSLLRNYKNELESAEIRFMRAALLTSTYDLYKSLNSEKNQNEKLKLSVMKYLSRISGRATPYGLLAGFCFGSIGNKTMLKFDSLDIRLHIKPDMGWFMRVATELESYPSIIRRLFITSNPLAEIRGGVIVIPNDPASKEFSNSDTWIHMARNEVVGSILLAAKDGIIFDELVNTIKKKYGITDEHSISLIREMLENGMLFSNFLSGCQNPYKWSKNKLQRLGGINFIKGKALLDILNNLLVYDGKRFTDSNVMDFIRWYTKIKSMVEGEINIKEKNIVHIDSEYLLPGLSINESVANAVAKATSVYMQLSYKFQKYDYLKDYRLRFLEKYGRDVMVTFPELISGMKGLGIPTIREDIEKETGKDQIELTRLAVSALSQKRIEVEITDEMLSNWKQDSETAILPISVCAFASIVAESQSEVDKGNFDVMLGEVQGYYGALDGIGRFMYAMEDPKGFAAKVRKMEAEVSENSVIAEIVAIPKKQRLLNVLNEILPYDYAVTYMFNTEEGTKNIPLAEIEIGVEDGKFFTGWRGKKLILRKSNMLNPRYLPFPVRMLLRLSNDGYVHHWVDNTVIATGFVPSLRYGNAILSPAKWAFMAGKDVQINNFDTFYESFSHYAERMLLPKYIYIGMSDNKLLIDRSLLDSVMLLYEISKTDARLDKFTILYDGTKSVNSTPLNISGYKYVNEVVIPLVLDYRSSVSKYKTPILGSKSSINHSERVKIPFDGWVYSNLYMDRISAPRFVSNVLPEFIQKLRGLKGFEKWFFIMYSNPDFHIRLRIAGNTEFLLEKLLPLLIDWTKSLIESNAISRVTLETYEREIERYGGPKAIDFFEDLFYVDSEIAMGILYASMNGVIETSMVALAAYSFAKEMELAGLNWEAAVRMYRRWSSSVGKYPDKDFDKTLSTLTLLEKQENTDGKIISDMLSTVQGALVEIGSSFLSHYDLQNGGKRDRAMRSFFHMHCNRILGLDKNAEAAATILLKRYAEVKIYAGGSRKAL